MTMTALLEARLYRAAADDGRQDAAAEREFGASAVGRLVATLDGAERAEAAEWFHGKLSHAPLDRVNARAVRAFAAMRLPWTGAQAAVLAGRVTGQEDEVWSRTAPMVELAVAAMESLDPAELAALRPVVVELSRWAHHVRGTADRDGLRRRLDVLAPPEEDDATGLPRSVLDDDDAYGRRMRAEHADVLASPGVAAFLTHCATLAQPRATKKFRTLAGHLLASAPRGAEAVRLLLEEFAAQPETVVTVRWSYGRVSRARGLTGAANTCLVRGLLWVAADLEGDRIVPLVGACALHAGTGLGGSGGMSRNGNVATAAVAVLGSFEGARGEQAVSALAAVRAKVRNRTLLKSAERAQLDIAARAGLTPAQLRERAVPSMGLDARRARDFVLPGGCTALLAVDDAATAALTFRTPQGRVTRAAPKPVRDHSSAELAVVRGALKELRSLLSAERARLEECLAAGTEWTGADWQRYYADHPVTGALAGALLWEVRAADAHTWTAGLPERGAAGWALAGTDGTAAPVGAADLVRLWHPLRATVDDVQAWRTELTGRELRQPVRQVFREVYLLTPAEEETRSYSNRFAAHILRFPQARSLMAARGWSADHLGYWDGGYDGQAVRVLPSAGGSGWRARFFYQLVEREEDGHATASLCSTDQVRFERLPPGRAAWVEADLAEVPPLALSEAMRDVDLFVGVSSIAADPQWQDGGDDRHADYWRRTAFGDLPSSAQVRKEALARLLPRTRIADRVEIAGRFLRVRGELGVYRIHIGSGNVLMEPHDAYLCIVTDRRGRAPGRLFLPFEEDGGMLAVVLSKAFLLADDVSITDPSILRQLPGRSLPA